MIYSYHTQTKFVFKHFGSIFYGICSPPGLLPVLGPCEWYMNPTLDAALLISSRVGTDQDLSSVAITVLLTANV